MKIAIIVHGGAGAWRLEGERMADVITVCGEAAVVGRELLNDGRSALDAVEAAVRILEDCPFTDAGVGSYLTSEGDIEMDALIMDGSTLDLGAVGAVGRVRNPISLARSVMSATEHAFLAGVGADAFADRIGHPRCESADLVVGEEKRRYLHLLEKKQYETHEIFVEPNSMGTVGAVAMDTNGNLAVATSTGGTRRQLPGRIGDTPLAGSGAYADNWTGACSATGHGEALMKVVISKQVCDFAGMGLSAAAACEAAIHLLEERVSGRGGVIAIDARGGVGFARNTEGMPYAMAIGDAEVVSGY